MDKNQLLFLSPRLGFSPSLCANGDVRQNHGADARVIVGRIAITPTVVVLCRDLSCTQLGGLLLPGSEPLIKISRLKATLRDFRAEADHAIHSLYPKQLAILQREQRVHQTVHCVNVRNRNPRR